MTSEQLVQAALDAGFTYAAPMDVSTLHPLPEVRAMCEANTCHRYGACWTCPPGCGTLEECTEKMHRYAHGVIVQTVGDVEDSLDIESMIEINRRHKEAFSRFAEQLRDTVGDILALSAGSCEVCKQCAYPDAPCRFPEKAFSSMEANGLVVNEVAKANGLAYNYGPQKMAYTSCYLYNE